MQEIDIYVLLKVYGFVKMVLLNNPLFVSWENASFHFNLILPFFVLHVHTFSLNAQRMRNGLDFF